MLSHDAFTMITAMNAKQREFGQDGAVDQGGVLLLVVMLMIVFIAMMTYTLRFVVRQSHETINQEQEEQAFWAADSGVSYALWLLDGGNKVPGDFTTPLPSFTALITDHAVTDDLGQQIGSFSLVDIVEVDSTLQLRSIGKDVNLSNRCQSIEVGLRQLQPGEPYVVTQWNHQVGYPCT